MMMASLIVVNGPNKGDYYPLGRRTTVIGRDEALPIQIIDPHISRKHMKIHFHEDNETYSAIDMDSKHGTLVNGIPVKDEIILQDNDYITVGQTHLLFTLKEFENRENALLHYKKVGQRNLPTITPDAMNRFGQ
jgi:pSer/pThr/pTyr-binding forkhead associated (FHA) protein